MRSYRSFSRPPRPFSSPPRSPAAAARIDPSYSAPSALCDQRAARQRAQGPDLSRLCGAGDRELHAYPATRSAEFAGAWRRRLQISGRYRLAGGEGRRRLPSPSSRRPRAATRSTPNSSAIGRRAKAAGIPRGAYHFVYWCRPPHEETGFFKAVVPGRARRAAAGARRRGDADLAELQAHALSRGGAARHARHARGAWSAITARSRSSTARSISIRRSCIRARWSDYPIWVRSTKYHPTVRYGDRKWTFWQYRSDGHVPGISGAVDQNTFHGSPAQWREWLASSHRPRGAAGRDRRRPSRSTIAASRQLIEEDPAMLPSAMKNAQ